MSQKCGNVGFGVARRRYAFSHHVTDGHFVANVEVPRDNVSTVELVADDAGANGVAIQTDEQVEKRRAVANLDIARAIEIDGGQGFFGKVEGVEVALFVGQVRIWFQVFQRDFFFFRKRIFRRHKHMQRGRKERFKDQIVLLNKFFDDFFVLVAQIKYANFAF